MKVVILAGGRPSTISNDQEAIPKPMVEVGGRPLLWHIMKNFSKTGINDFIVCGGYKVDLIKQYFMDFYIYESDITVDLQSNDITIHKKKTENWKVTVVDTGLDASTSERVAKIKDYIDDDSFLVTYGDCLSNINVDNLINAHEKSNKLVTMVTAKTAGRNEAVRIGKDGILLANSFDVNNNAWTNASMYIMKNQVLTLLDNPNSLETVLTGTLMPLGEIMTYQHDGFWAPVETYRDLVQMENLWKDGTAPWMK